MKRGSLSTWSRLPLFVHSSLRYFNNLYFKARTFKQTPIGQWTFSKPQPRFLCITTNRRRYI